MSKYIKITDNMGGYVPDDTFYHTAEYKDWWRKVIASSHKDAEGHPLCENCRRYGKQTPAKVVHHRIPRKQRPDLELDPSNGIALCAACHNAAHPEKGGRKGHPPLCRRRFE